MIAVLNAPPGPPAPILLEGKLPIQTPNANDRLVQEHGEDGEDALFFNARAALLRLHALQCCAPLTDGGEGAAPGELEAIFKMLKVGGCVCAPECVHVRVHVCACMCVRACVRTTVRVCAGGRLF